MIHLVTFASEDMSISAQRCVESGLTHGCNAASTELFAELKDSVFRRIQDRMFGTRGVGYWVWKPWIISDTLAELPTDSILIYSDAGVEFIEPVQTVIDRMDQDIFLFGNQTEHAHWCKRDIIDEVWKLPPDINGDSGRTPSWSRFGKQAQASVIFFRVNDYTRKFVKEWLDWCLFEGGRLIDDSPSRTPNHPEFKENRHDQAILTTLAYREGIKLHEWYVTYEQYTPGHLDCYPKEFEQPLFRHHRFRNSDWQARGVAA
jgi:hypothetical protein